MRPVDIVVCGSVAVNRAGVRLGKGTGYSDIEAGLITDHTSSTPPSRSFRVIRAEGQ